MNGVSKDADRSVPAGFLRCPFWALVLFALFAWQLATTLTLFSPDRSFDSLLDDRPILSGLHPLHLYHGLLGAQSWREGGFGCCYDPAFQAGYPKTPVFDSGSRPGELFLLVGHQRPAAYKMGLAICCALVPLAFAASGRLLGLGSGASCLAAVFGILLWWGPPVQHLLARGQLDWLMAGLTLVLHASMLVRFHRSGHPLIWLGLLVTAALGWFTHPVLWLAFGLLFAPFFVCVATGHCLFWNCSLLLSWTGGLLLNYGWLRDWVKNYWIQMPMPMSNHETWTGSLTKWFAADLGGARSDQSLAILVLGGGMIGVVGFLARKRWAAGLTFGATSLLLPTLSVASGFWKPLDVAGMANLFVLACAFAIIPCASAFRDLSILLGMASCHPIRGKAITLVLLAAAICSRRDEVAELTQQASRATLLRVGFTPDQQAIIRTVRKSTQPDTRILWEERPNHPTPSWTALLPQNTGRAFLGGLGPDATVDHSYARLTSTELAGKRISEWTDAELSEFCTHYNVGHIVCWSPEVIARFRAWSLVHEVAQVRENGSGWLFAIDRQGSYVLKGKAHISQFDSERIVLSNVEPQDGVVVLSLHYQNGFHIYPRDVRAEREPDPDDPIPRLRLRITRPIREVMLSWAKR
jgi:hypothetical protein